MIKKDNEIKFRCTGFEKILIKQKATQTGRTISEYCRLQAVKGKIISRPKLSEEEKEYFRSLKTHNLNFTRIANLLKSRDPNFTVAIFVHLDNMKKLYQKFFPQ